MIDVHLVWLSVYAENSFVSFSVIMCWTCAVVFWCRGIQEMICLVSLLKLWICPSVVCSFILSSSSLYQFVNQGELYHAHINCNNFFLKYAFRVSLLRLCFSRLFLYFDIVEPCAFPLYLNHAFWTSNCSLHFESGACLWLVVFNFFCALQSFWSTIILLQKSMVASFLCPQKII